MISHIISFILLLFNFQPAEFTAKVITVEDGDTLEVLYQEKKIKVRVFAIDCPEDGQAFSTKARQYTMGLCANKNVKIKVNNTDPRGRIVGEVFLEDGRSLAKILLSLGYAWHYKQYSDDKELAKLEEEAKKAKKGLWIENNPVSPWAYKAAKQGKQ